MDTRQLQYFITVCETRNITAAAEALFISQQTLSASISRLEKELKTDLFVRSVKGVEPTKAGLYLLEKARKMLSIEAEMTRYLGSFQNIPINLKVGCAYGVVHEFPEKLLSSMELSARTIRPKYIEYTDLRCEKAVARGEIELGFAIGPIDNNKFHSHKILSRNFCFILNSTHPLAKQETLSLSQLKDEPLIMLNEQFKANALFRSLCRQNGFTPNFVFEAGEIAPIKTLVRKQYGIGVSTDFIASGIQSPDLCTRFLNDVSYTWDIYLIWKKDGELSETAKAFVDFILS